MYLARFSYEIAPKNRQSALNSIRQEADAARAKRLTARILIPLTRAHGGAALQFEIELKSLDQLEEFRHGVMLPHGPGQLLSVPPPPPVPPFWW